MKKMIIFAVIAAVLFSIWSFAAGPDKDKPGPDDLLSFLENTYEVVGRYPEGGAAYTGIVTLTRKGDDLVMTREIGGSTVTGTAKLVLATADEVTVLQAEFVEGKQKYQITYLIGSDLDNYARLSGWVYFKGKETKKSGMETLFILLAPPRQ